MTAPRRIALRDLPPVPKGHCCWCRQPVKPPRRSWCGQACIDEYLIRSNPRHARDKVWERDQGVCRRCGLDVDALEEAKRTLVDETSGPRRVPGREIFRYEDRAPEQPAWREALAVMALLGFSQREAWRAGQHLWEMDHIVPVSEGGGGCGLENLRLLCLPCHRAVTAEWRAQRAAERSPAAPPPAPDPQLRLGVA